ncbi:hypothetical protein J4Q44_G00361070 [Coregonus suidteri]|uniref:Secreted protein n=1 Tax=Coregonus suidteri TaxID=861788 RepID=A0AAN8QBN5_9TELE
MSSSPELYSFLLIALNPVLSLSVCLPLCLWGDTATRPPKSLCTLGQNPPTSGRSTRVRWKVGTRLWSTAICSTLHSFPPNSPCWSPCSTHRSMSAPLRPQGSLAARWRSSRLMLCRRGSGRTSLEQHRTVFVASERLSTMVFTTWAQTDSSNGL